MARPTALVELVERSAAPALVDTLVDRVLEAQPGAVERIASDADLARAVVAVAGASRFLGDLLVSDPGALEVLATPNERPQPGGGGVDDMRRWKGLEMLRIAARDLTGIDDLPAVGEALARLAAEVLDLSCRHVGAEELCVIGMGKLGGQELNYASDIDIMFVSDTAGPDAERQARSVLEVARTCFRVDVDLRPEGRDGPLVRTLASYETYWDRWAKTWEFQALLKSAPVAGHVQVGRAFAESARRRLWERPFTAEDLRAVRDLKARAEGEMRRKGTAQREVKRGPGGIRDIEFSVQLLQLVHGHSDPGLRGRTTLDMLAELGNSGYVDPGDARSLDQAYRFLRVVEHRIQLVNEQQSHTVPTSPVALDRLARVMGYRDAATSSAADLLEDDLRRHRATVRSIHEHLFFRPLLDTLTAAGEPSGMTRLSGEAMADRLAAFGFTDAARTRAALVELTRGLTRSSRLMSQMLPLLLGWLSESPDPDLGLLGLRVLAVGRQQTTELATAFRESPEAARRLCLLLGTGRRLAESLEHNPDMIPELAQPGALDPRPEIDLCGDAAAAASWRDDVVSRQGALLRFKRREELRAIAADVLGEYGPDDDGVTATGGRLATLAEACLGAALDSLEPDLPFAIIAMGRFGGFELSYASDLDLLFVYEDGGGGGAGGGAGPVGGAGAGERLAERLLKFLEGPTPVGRIYPVDLGLRPEGKNGPLARSLDGYRSYYGRWAAVWERLALVRARPVAGDTDLGRRFMEMAEAHVWTDGLNEADARELRRIKARVERERIPSGEDAQFHLKLGPGSLSDVEFCAQMLQLRHGVRGTSTLGALASLVDQGILEAADHEVLAEAYRFCERTRNRLRLVRETSGDSLPSRPETLVPLARSLDTNSADLREQYRRVTRRSRQVVERLFYGRE